MLACWSALAVAGVPANAPAHLMTVKAVQAQYWPDHPNPAYLASQIETESCVSLTARLCWSPHAELKTSREYGFGLGQITVTPAFNNFTAARQLAPELKSWQWADRFDARKQVVTLVLMDRTLYRSCTKLMTTGREAYACALASYNGGLGGTMADRRLCANTQGCDPRKWFGNVERTSLKAKKPVSGYGKSFFDINRAYPVAIMDQRRPKYDPFFKGK